MLGDFEVTAPSDGMVALPVDTGAADLFGSPPLALPGFDHLRAEGKGYAWAPLNHSGLK